jgi:hypothetical protein
MMQRAQNDGRDSTLQSAEQVLTATNALRDPYEAEQAGVRLQLP